MANWGDSTYSRQIMALERVLEEVGLHPLGVGSALAAAVEVEHQMQR